MDEVARLPIDDRRTIFTETAANAGLSAVIAEKDFWVCWALDKLYAMDGMPRLLFKGGTSLSKCFRLIERFSEDIDLGLHREDIGLGGPSAPSPDKGSSSQKKARKWLRAGTQEYVGTRFLSSVREGRRPVRRAGAVRSPSCRVQLRGRRVAAVLRPAARERIPWKRAAARDRALAARRRRRRVRPDRAAPSGPRRLGRRTGRPDGSDDRERVVGLAVERCDTIPRVRARSRARARAAAPRLPRGGRAGPSSTFFGARHRRDDPGRSREWRAATPPTHLLGRRASPPMTHPRP
jgi:Nucleotidyl transferase AbiEii toxin, Type IV TA system